MKIRPLFLFHSLRTKSSAISRKCVIESFCSLHKFAK